MSDKVSGLDDEDEDSEVSGSKRDSLAPSSLDFWDYSVELECLEGPEDLQLAAELGKTLLERNKELEMNLKEYQRIQDNHVKEIEYLTKQLAALRKTNDERIRIYEQLEVSIQDLEIANQKLALDNSAQKKQNKSLCAYRDMLEANCEELQKALDEARNQQQCLKKQIRNLSRTKEDEKKMEKQEKVQEAGEPGKTSPTDEDFVNSLTQQNQHLKNQISKDQRKIADLEEETSRMIQDIALLTEELKERELMVGVLRSQILEADRPENFCVRCGKELGMDDEELALLEGEPLDPLRRTLQVGSPYVNLVKMYQFLPKKQQRCGPYLPENHMSLKDELRFTDYNADFEHGEKREGEGRSNAFPDVKGADLSEEETSSGFCDETCNKSTQTERNTISGSFLCSIAEGDDCKFSIYDDACPIDSRFKKNPGYRTLFREIFDVLKRAAEAKDRGERLPLLENSSPPMHPPKAPPATPATENPPDTHFPDPTDADVSADASEASEASSVAGEKPEPDLADLKRDASEPPIPAKGTNDLLQYITGKVKRKSKRKVTDSPARRIPEGADAAATGSPRKTPGRRRKEWRALESPRTQDQSPGITRSPAHPRPPVLTTLERRNSPRSPHTYSLSTWWTEPFVSTASLEFAKLKNLEKSYAEVLRHTPKNFTRAKPFVSTAYIEFAKLKNLEKSYAEVLRHTPKNFARAKPFE